MLVTRPRLFIALALVALAFPASARAEDPVEAGAPQPPPAWRVDMRVVQVTGERATAEAAPTLPGTDALGRTTASWAEILAALQKRGDVRIRMDRSATTTGDAECRLVASRTDQVMVDQSSSGGVTNRYVQPVREGAEATLIFRRARTEPARLEFRIVVNWLDRPNQSLAPTQLVADWGGSETVSGAGSLVLRHAEQGEKEGATEIYVLLSWRR